MKYKGEKEDFYASNLTSDPDIDQDLLELNQGRFSNQENDSKYKKKHFGLDSIISYACLPEQNIQSKIDQKQGKYQALKQQNVDLKKRLEKLFIF